MEPSSSSPAASAAVADQGKLFVGGISNGIREEELRGYFARYGEVKDVTVVKDKITGNARGFAFVQFADPEAAERVLRDKAQHLVADRTVEVKRARPRGEQRRNYQSPQHHHYPPFGQHEYKGPSKSDTNINDSDETLNHTRSKKIFVGGLSSSVTEEEFKTYFEKFGRITDVVIMYDSTTHRPRGFGFITFDSEEAVDNVMKKSYHELSSKLVEVKIAVPKDDNHHDNNNYSGNKYSSRVSGGRGSNYGNHHGGAYPPYSPRYGFYTGYAPPPPVSGFYYGAAGYGGGYAIGSYGGYGYGVPYASPRSPWNGPGLVAARRSPAPYGNSTMYPGYFNTGFDGYMGMPSGGYRGFVWSGNGKLNQTSADVQITEDNTSPSEVGSTKLDAQQAS